MHFVYLVPPVSVRRDNPHYMWTLLKWLHRTNGREVSLLTSGAYLEAIEHQTGDAFSDAAREVYGYGLTSCISGNVKIYTYDAGIVEELCASQPNSFALLYQYIRSPELNRRLFEPALTEIKRLHGEVTVVTWLNCNALRDVCLQLGIRTVFNELGPLRHPFYAGTAYFDESGVNGETSAANSFRSEYRDFQAWMHREQLDLSAVRSLISYTDFELPSSDVAGSDIGVALQMESDSNAIAYARGWSVISLLDHARNTGARITVRHHPGSIAMYPGPLDRSPTTYEFIRSVRSVWTINSSVAAEALFWGKDAQVFGDSPVDHIPSLSKELRELAICHFLLVYLIPFNLVFDLDYYEWRLTRPSAGDIAARHVQEYQRARESAVILELRQKLASEPVPSQEVAHPYPAYFHLFLEKEHALQGQIDYRERWQHSEVRLTSTMDRLAAAEGRLRTMEQQTADLSASVKKSGLLVAELQAKNLAQLAAAELAARQLAEVEATCAELYRLIAGMFELPLCRLMLRLGRPRLYRDIVNILAKRPKS